eukprot:359311-Chlamydomonas_euryale.AAC.1
MLVGQLHADNARRQRSAWGWPIYPETNEMWPVWPHGRFRNPSLYSSTHHPGDDVIIPVTYLPTPAASHSWPALRHGGLVPAQQATPDKCGLRPTTLEPLRKAEARALIGPDRRGVGGAPSSYEVAFIRYHV